MSDKEFIGNLFKVDFYMSAWTGISYFIAATLKEELATWHNAYIGLLLALATFILGVIITIICLTIWAIVEKKNK